jgi:hypothetical protein
MSRSSRGVTDEDASRQAPAAGVGASRSNEPSELTTREEMLSLPRRFRCAPSCLPFVLVALLLLLVAPWPAAAAPGPAPDPAPLGAPVPAAFEALHQAAPRLDERVLSLALTAAECAIRANAAPGARYLTVIDYSLPSTRRRLWLFDLAERRLVARELVAHGVNTGENRATRFSNVDGSRQTSLGLFRTAETYYGRNGYSLRLDGLEDGFNDLARPRTIVVHGAWYVSDDFARQHGRLGRSWGCPALDQAVSRKIIDRIKDGHLLFSYYPDQEWLERSGFFRCDAPRAPAPPVVTTEVAAAAAR